MRGIYYQEYWGKGLEIVIPSQRLVYTTPAGQGTEGAYTLVASTTNTTDITTVIMPGESVSFGASVQGYKSSEKELYPDVPAELAAREEFVNQLGNSLVFDSPDNIVNTQFAFAKIRAAESIFGLRAD